MLKTILKKYTIILLPILLLPILLLVSFHEAVAQDHARGRGGRGWGIGSSYNSTSLVAYLIRETVASESDNSKTSSHLAAPSIMYRKKKHISYRLIVSQFDYSDSTSETEGDSSYDVELNFALGSDALIANLHPFGGRFYFALGVTDFELKASLDGRGIGKGSDMQKETVDVNGTPTEIDIDVAFEVSGDVGGSLAYEGLAGYTGFGWGTKYPDKKGFGMRFEIGIIHMPDPEVNLYVRDVALDARFNESKISTASVEKEIEELLADSEKYETELEEDASQLDMFPVIEIGISYHF